MLAALPHGTWTTYRWGPGDACRVVPASGGCLSHDHCGGGQRVSGTESPQQEFRRLLNKIPDVDIPASRIAPRPSFPLSVLADPAAIDAMHEALTRFADAGRAIDES